MIGNWYVMRVYPRAVEQAVQALATNGLETYLPKTKSNKIGYEQSYSPLFPGYLFVKCNNETRELPRFRSTSWFSGWVSFDGFVPSLSDQTIAELTYQVEQLSSNNGIWRRFLVGEKVNITSNGIESMGEIMEERRSPQSQAKVLLQFLGRLVEAKVPWKDIRALDSKLETVTPRTRRTRGKGRVIRNHKVVTNSL